MEFRLRRADAADADALALVAGATFLESYSAMIGRDDMLAHLAARSSPDRFRAWIGDGHSIVTLAEAPVGGAPLGYTVLTTPDLPVEPRDGDIELLRIYALATGWGAGPGTAMMERAVADARAGGFARMMLGTHPENWRAQRFYRKHRFDVIGRRRFRVGSVEFDDPIYARAI